MPAPPPAPHTTQFSLARTVFDPAWLFLVSGLAILAAGVVVPAQDRRDEVRWHQGRAQAMLSHANQRAERYEILDAALDRADRSLVKALVASQLNLVPADDLAERDGGDGGAMIVLASSAPDANVLASVEPEFPSLSTHSLARRVRDTRLRRLVTDPGSRLGLLIGGCICVSIGLFSGRAVR